MLCCNGLHIQREEDATEIQQSESITVADLEVTNSSNIQNNNYKTVNLCGTRFSCQIGKVAMPFQPVNRMETSYS